MGNSTFVVQKMTDGIDNVKVFILLILQKNDAETNPRNDKNKEIKMKVKGKKIEIVTGEPVELEESDYIQIIVPQSDGRTSVHLTVVNGKLEISGGASIIDSIRGPGMAEKVSA